jgi:sulfite exporter TauE/SafE
VHNEEIGHEHVHPDGVNHGTRQNLITSFLVGVFHGFAGFSHLVALLPTLALPSESDAIAYLFAFATGTIITMMIFSWFFGYVAYHSLAKKNHRFLHWYSLTGGLLAIAVGVYWLIGSL